MTRKWSTVNDQSNGNYDVVNVIIYNTEVLKSNLHDYNDGYILVRGDIIVIAVHSTQESFKYWVQSNKCITKSDGTTTDDAEDLELVMLIYNLLVYTSNYSDMTGCALKISK